MAVVTRKSRNSKSLPTSTSTRKRREPEAPDRGVTAGEAPEHRPDGRHPEAPDAGEGRMALVEHEFTHGRSQS